MSAINGGMDTARTLTPRHSSGIMSTVEIMLTSPDPRPSLPRPSLDSWNGRVLDGTEREIIADGLERDRLAEADLLRMPGRPGAP